MAIVKLIVGLWLIKIWADALLELADDYCSYGEGKENE